MPLPAVACRQFTTLSVASSCKADQITYSAFVNLGTVIALAAACNKTPAFPSNLIIQWIEVG